MDPFISQLASLARNQRTRTKWVFIPYASLKWTLSERLLHNGCEWSNFRFTTPFELALESTAPDLVARGVNPKPEGLGPSLLHKLLVGLPARTKPHFRQLIDQPGMAEALWATLREVRMAGLTHRQLSKALNGNKKSELTALLKAYETYLETHALADRAAVFQASGATAVQPEDLLLELPSTLWSPLERRFLDAQKAERIKPRAPSLPVPRRLEHAPRDPVAGEPPLPALFHAGRRDAEIAEILRRIQLLPLDLVELATADPDALPLLRDKLASCGLPATFEPGLPLAVSRPGMALQGLLSWVEHRYSAFDLRELLLSNLLQPWGLPASTAGYLLERSEATWDRSTYHARLTYLRSWLLQRGASADAEQADQVALLAQWIASLFKRLPVDAVGEADWAAWVRGLDSILEHEISVFSAEDRAARWRLKRALNELLLLEGQRWSVEETVRSLRQKLEPLSFAGSRALPGHVHVTTLDRVGWTGRPHVYLLGLEEGRIGGVEAEDSVLSDAERAALHPLLATSADRAAERLFQIHERLAAVEGAVTFSYSTRDLRTGQELLPSWLFFSSARRVRPFESFEGLASYLGEPIGYASPEGPGESEWWLARAGPEEPVLEAFPALAAGARAARERASDRFTLYDGYVPSAAGVLDPRRTGEPISVSRLESLAACPFRYFLERGLRLRALDLSRPDPERWLDEAARGQVLHDIFARFHRDLRSRGWRPSFERDRTGLEKLLDEALDALREALPPPSPAVARSERRLLLRDLENFLRLESHDTSRKAMGFEVAFGQDDLQGEPLARADPVTILGGLPLRGRIDRIDQLADGLEVVDYKTGRRLKIDKGRTYQGGRLLQHALYALVVEELAGQRVRGSSYYFPAVHAIDERVFFPYPDKRALGALIRDVLEPLETGAFLHTDQPEQDCAYCDFQAACRANTKEAARAKLAQELNTRLAYRRRAGEVP